MSEVFEVLSSPASPHESGSGDDFPGGVGSPSKRRRARNAYPVHPGHCTEGVAALGSL